ncbi:MAG TPA: hypothetical protein VNH63_02455 [Gemmatimonadales bacterium]|nr:hypothetical protein [Gemmatimonadales bacterium]
MRTIATLCLVVLLLVACSKGQQARGSESGGAGNDPCTLVSRAEAEQLMGPLRHDPFRVNSGGNRVPQPNGTACFYETANGRRVIMDVDWKDGQMAMKVVAMGGRLAEQAIATDTGQADTLEGRWDELRMLPGDNIYARKGDQMVSIDYLGSGLGLAGAAKWAHIALGRFGHPLAYDGAAAGRTAPGPLVTPRDPCTLVDRADVERIIGALAGAGVVGPHQDVCTYTLAQSRGLAGNKVDLRVSWKDGWAAIENSRHMTDAVVAKVAPSAAMAHGSTDGGQQQGAPGTAGGDGGLGGFMNKLMGAARSQGFNVQTDSNGKLQSDTAVAGPWDAGALVNGSGLYVVKHDALLTLDLRGITYEQAKALLAKAVERL